MIVFINSIHNYTQYSLKNEEFNTLKTSTNSITSFSVRLNNTVSKIMMIERIMISVARIPSAFGEPLDSWIKWNLACSSSRSLQLHSKSKSWFRSTQITLHGIVDLRIDSKGFVQEEVHTCLSACFDHKLEALAGSFLEDSCTYLLEGEGKKGDTAGTCSGAFVEGCSTEGEDMNVEGSLKVACGFHIPALVAFAFVLEADGC